MQVQSAREVSILNEDEETESSQHRQESFVRVFQNNAWGLEAKSGPGSLLINSRRVISILNILVEKIKKQTGKEKVR